MYMVKKEIDDQFKALERTVQYLDQEADKIVDFLINEQKIIVFGCGSSFSVAKSYALLFTGMTGKLALPVAAGDYIVNSKDYASLIKDALIITVSRSGSTSEIIRAVKLAKDAGAHKVLSICAVKDAGIAVLADLNLEMPWIYDHSVCQTRTVNNLYASGVMIAALLAGDEVTVEGLRKLSSYYGDFEKRYSSVFEEIAKREWRYGVVLADSYMAGLAEEGALAFKEICQLNSNYYHVLDVRHGPMVMINKETLVISMISSGDRALQQDLLSDIKKKGAFSVVLDCVDQPVEQADVRIVLPQLNNDKVAALFMLYCIQNITYQKALKRGINPDQPDGLDAWIKLA